MKELPEKLTKPYESTQTEARIYKMWEESGFFNPDNLPSRHQEPFSIVIPPPNVTGVLHMGSAMMIAIEDTMVRYARMQGKKTLWIPGTDHAAIATQSKVEKEIQKNEGKSRHDLGREELLKRVEAFAKDSHDTIVNQVRKMGSSIDWSREAFTLDEKRSHAVRTAFKKMYEDGLIYRGYRVVNWDPKGQTTISDDEIVYEERDAKLYTFKYSHDFPIPIATTRPETKLGDVAVAVHPTDERYKEYIGKEYTMIFAGESITVKIVGDIAVDPEFGTGAVGVTPAHSMIDYEIAQRHNLPIKPIINEYAKLTVGSEDIKGKKTTEARTKVVEWLTEQKLLIEEKPIKQNISLAERTSGVIEPLPKRQWFIAVNKKFIIPESNIPGIKAGQEVTLKKLMLAAVQSKQTTIIPDRFEKIYFHWVENLRDWCISRQIWYGHRVPVWYKKSSDEMHVDVSAPQGDDWMQDEDTLDTWFSSGLWTFSTLGWPNEEEFKSHRQYHPNTIIETGSDILFFWIARMILMSTYLIHEVPFKTVYLHGLVRDEKGRKISKSLGNNIDPIDMIEKYGADATRMSLIIGVGPGNDSKLGEDKLKNYKHFSNKVWNASRFVLSNIDETTLETPRPPLTKRDEEILMELNKVTESVTTHMNNFRYHLAGEELYHYFWHTFADVIIEEMKIRIQDNNTESKKASQWILLKTLSTTIKMLHPFMPFVTEELWSLLPKKTQSLLIIETWPKQL